MEEKTRFPMGSRSGGMAFSAVVSAYLLISLIATGIIRIGGLSGTDAGKYINYIVSPLAILALFLFTVLYAKQPIKRLLPVRTHPKFYLIGVLLIFGLLFSLNWVNEYLIRLFELMGYKRNANTLPDISGWKIIPAIIFIAIVPAIAEEVLFRGIILNNAEQEAGSIRTVFLVGLCFSLYHGSVEQTVYQFICGCLFAFLAIRSGSIVPSVVIHFINNALIIILYACGCVDAVTGEILTSQVGTILIYVFSALSLIGAVVWLFLCKKLYWPGRTGGVKNFFIGAAPGLIVMAIIWIIGLFV